MIRAAAIGGLVMTMAIAASAVVAQDVSPWPEANPLQSDDTGGGGDGKSQSFPSRKKELPPLPFEPKIKSVWPETTQIQPVLPQVAAPPAIAPSPAPAPAVVAAQIAASRYSSVPFSESELLAGKRMTEAQCTEQPSAVWVVVGGTAECIVYYHMTGRNRPVRHPAMGGKAIVVGAADASGDTTNTADPGSVVVFLTGDAVTVNGRGDAKPVPSYGKITPKQMLIDSAGWANNLEISYVTLARPGTYGSSGNHGERRSEREIAVVSAALDAIKARYNYQRLHLAGYAEGAHTAAMLMTRRGDLGCVVLASGLLSVKQHLAELGRTADWIGKTPLDPAGMRSRIVSPPDLRILVMTDPDDLVFSARSQTGFVRRMEGLRVQQIFRGATDPAGHNLASHARRMAADCARGQSDDVIRQKYENKVPAVPPDADDPPLHRPDMLRRDVFISEAQCAALKTALWLTVDGRKVCIRYWMSTAGGTRSEPLVFFDGDLGSNDGGRLALNPAAERISGGQLQRVAHYWSRRYGGPYVELARVGTLGSSGSHTKDRRTLFEVRVAAAALDALKAKYGWARLHVAGQSGGGHTVAGLARHRDDIGCAVMASGAIAVKLSHIYRGMQVGSNVRSKYDPYDQVLDKPFPAKLRMIVMSDPMDRIVSYGSQAAFVKLVRLTDTPILHLLTDAGDKDHHGLASAGMRATMDCAKGTADQDLIKAYHNTTARVARF